MKRKLIIAAAAAFLLALVAGAWFYRGAAPLTTGDTRMRMREGEDFVCASGQVDEAGTLALQQTFSLTNRTGASLEEIVLRLYANGAAGCIVQEAAVSVNGEACTAALDEEDATLLRVERPWAQGESIELTLLTTILTSPQGKTAVVPLPALAPLEGGEWHTGLWEPLAGTNHAPAMDGYLDVVYPQSLSVLFSGEAGYIGPTAGSTQGMLSAVMHTDGGRGMTCVISKGAAVRYREIGGVAVTAMAQGVLQAQKLLDCAQEALLSLEAIGLHYPFPSLAIVQAQPVSADGDAYCGLIVLDLEKNEEELLRRMTRLIARQTFGVSVGCDALGAPWLSHTLSSTAELLAFRQRKGEAAYETRFFEDIEVATRLTRPYGVNVGAGVDRFGGDAEMTQVLRDQGAAMMLGIGEAIGYDALARALCLYAQDNAGKIVDRQALEAALESVCGSSWNGYLTDELSY